VKSNIWHAPSAEGCAPTYPDANTPIADALFKRVGRQVNEKTAWIQEITAEEERTEESAS
jgi:hypothetical protein